LIFTHQTIKTCFFATGGLVLSSRAVGAVGIVGINSECEFASRAILTKSGTTAAERAVLTWNAVA
jgi:hypothetical protein